jgi:hypothetical protein
MGRGSVGGGSIGGGSDVGGGSALGTAHSAAACARALAAENRASGFAYLPDCSLAPYGSLSAAHLQLGSPMCCTVSALSTLPFLLPCFAPIHVVVFGQES